MQRTATGAEKFFDAPETLARLSSGSQSGNESDGGRIVLGPLLSLA